MGQFEFHDAQIFLDEPLPIELDRLSRDPVASLATSGMKACFVHSPGSSILMPAAWGSAMDHSFLKIEVSQFTNFPHVNEVSKLNDKDYNLLAEMRDLLVRHGAVDRFGVHLIHRHYDIDEDEIIVEYTDEEKRTQTTRVEKKSTLNVDNPPLETQWKFDRDSASMVCVGFCFYDRGHGRRHTTR